MSSNGRVFFSMIAAAALLTAAPAAAQHSPFSLELRSGVTFPTGDLSDAGIEAGPLFGLDVFAVDRALSVYGGWGYHQFSDDVTASGPRLGLKAIFRTPGYATPWIRAGATFNEADGSGGSSDRELGLEAGAGLDYELSDRVSLTPAARYHTFSPDFGAGSSTFSYLTLDLGVHLHF